MAVAYRNIAAIYDLQGNFEQAIIYLNKDLAVHTKMNNQTGIGRALNNLAYLALKANQLNKAEELVKKALGVNAATKTTVN